MSDETKAEVPHVRPGQRIAKVIARAGICSRRDAEAWIAEGRVSVNGEVLSSPAFNVSEADDVRVDGRRLGAAERTRLFLFHKPRGFVTTARDPEGRPTVFDALPPGLPRVVAVGRLDINTEGLMLLTNDGGLARVLELPSTGWLRRYRVRAHGTIDQAALDALGGGITLDGVAYQGIEARLDREQGSNVWITLGLREGKNREIKKVLEHLGLAVNRLIRVSFGPFELGDLAEGEAAEVRTRVLRDQLGAKLAKEAGADFDAPLIARDVPAPTEPSADERSARRASAPDARSGGHKPERSGERERGRERKGRVEPDAAARRAPAAPSTPERRRKHVSRLRAETAADAAATRKRIERSATHDRKGRTIAVERLSPTREEARRRAEAETRKPRAERPNAKQGGRERGRPPRSDNRDGGRGAFEPRPRRAEEREGGRRDRGFDRPQGRSQGHAGEIRPPRADGKDRAPRSEFKPRKPRPEARGGAQPGRRFGHPADERRGEREFDRPHGRQTGDGGGPPRARSSPWRPPSPPGKGPPKGRGGPRRPPRKP
jgi:23S rRNA pseudouridine2605 synthase